MAFRLPSWTGPILILAFTGAAMGYIGKQGATPPPDPNDPADVGMMDPLVLQRNLKWASDFVNERVGFKDIDDAKGRALLAEYARQLTEHIDLAKIKPADAWRYAEVFRTAQIWDRARETLQVAVDYAMRKGQRDRIMNDTLRLAQAEANLGNVAKAIRLVQSTFTAEPGAKAPILLATYLEIVPPSINRGLDKELAELIEGAIVQHTLTVVDPNSEAGSRFIAVRGYHIAKASELATSLYRAAGREDLAQKVEENTRKAVEAMYSREPKAPNPDDKGN